MKKFIKKARSLTRQRSKIRFYCDENFPVHAGEFLKSQGFRIYSLLQDKTLVRNEGDMIGRFFCWCLDKVFGPPLTIKQHLELWNDEKIATHLGITTEEAGQFVSLIIAESRGLAADPEFEVNVRMMLAHCSDPERLKDELALLGLRLDYLESGAMTADEIKRFILEFMRED